MGEEVSGTVSHDTEVVAFVSLAGNDVCRLHHIITKPEFVELWQEITSTVVLELNDESNLAEESDQEHRVELSRINVPSLVTEFSEGVLVGVVVKKDQDTGLVVSENFLKGVVSVVDLGTTLDVTELAKLYAVGVVVEISATDSGSFAQRCTRRRRFQSVTSSRALSRRSTSRGSVSLWSSAVPQRGTSTSRT